VTDVEPTAAVERLYGAFSTYSYSGRDFCPCCYTPEEWHYIATTPLRELGVDYSRKLLWETADHWESADVYRHYLPRLLEMLGAPWRVDVLYPSHLFETLVALGFRGWSPGEKTAVIDYLDALGFDVRGVSDDQDRREWAAGLAALRTGPHKLPLPQSSGGEDK
jgi:hypothetical protein